MKKKISKDIGIILNWKPEDFDLNTAYEWINKEYLYAWGTGGVTLTKYAELKLPDGIILGLLKTSGKNDILYGATIDVSQEFREYLKPRKNKRKLKEEHKKYRPDSLRERKRKNFLFLSDLFILNSSIQANEIIKINGEPFSRGDRSSVFIDLKKSGIDPNEIKRKDFNSFSDNPLVQILEYKENDLTSAFRFLLKNHMDLVEEFFKLCDIDKNPINFEIYLRKKIENSKKRNMPDMTFEWPDDGFEIFVEVKLDSPVNKNQLIRYSKKGKVICITRSGEEKEVRGVKFVSWEDIYRIFEEISNNNRGKNIIIIKYFLGYLTYLGIQ